MNTKLGEHACEGCDRKNVIMVSGRRPTLSSALPRRLNIHDVLLLRCSQNVTCFCACTVDSKRSIRCC